MVYTMHQAHVEQSMSCIVGENDKTSIAIWFCCPEAYRRLTPLSKTVCLARKVRQGDPGAQTRAEQRPERWPRRCSCALGRACTRRGCCSPGTVDVVS